MYLPILFYQNILTFLFYFSTIGVWKRRFPVIGLTLRLSLPNIFTVIIATAVLHNICRNGNLPEVPPEVELPADDNDVNLRADNEPIGIQDVANRDDLINNYFSC